MSLGILVHGDNHLILSGPLPSRECARHLASVFALSLVPLGPPRREHFEHWQIRTREFRENLEWAIQLNAPQQPVDAVRTLLEELVARGVRVHGDTDFWEGVPCD